MRRARRCGWSFGTPICVRPAARSSRCLPQTSATSMSRSGFVRRPPQWRWTIRRMRPFRSLSARLTVQFALLFAAAMLVVSAALSTFIAGSASREVENQLQSSGAVYDRLWQQRARELQNAAQLLARDFGFRAAVASGDQATMQSALGNAATRLRVRSAFIVTADGRVSAIGPAVTSNEASALWNPLDDGRLTGVSVLAGRP